MQVYEYYSFALKCQVAEKLMLPLCSPVIHDQLWICFMPDLENKTSSLSACEKVAGPRFGGAACQMKGEVNRSCTLHRRWLLMRI